MTNCFCRNLFVAGIVLAAASVWAGPADAEKIYKAARHNLATADYMTKSVSPSGKATKTTTFYQQVSPDGIVRTKKEIKTEPADPKNPFNPYIVITNEDGYFHLSPKGAIKVNFQMGRNPLNDRGLSVSYKLEESEYEGKPCYKITRRIVLNQAARRAYIESLPPDMQQHADVNTFFPALEVMLVGKDDLFPREIVNYSQAGKLIEKRSFSGLVINPAFSSDLFNVSSSKVRVANSMEEYTDTTSGETKEAVMKNLPGARRVSWWSKSWSAAGNWFDRNFSAVVNAGVWAGIAIAVLAVAAAIVLKVRRR